MPLVCAVSLTLLPWTAQEVFREGVGSETSPINRTWRVLKTVDDSVESPLFSESLLTQAPSKCILLLQRRQKKAIIERYPSVPQRVGLEELGGVPGSPVCISSAQ